MACKNKVLTKRDLSFSYECSLSLNVRLLSSCNKPNNDNWNHLTPDLDLWKTLDLSNWPRAPLMWQASRLALICRIHHSITFQASSGLTMQQKMIQSPNFFCTCSTILQSLIIFTNYPQSRSYPKELPTQKMLLLWYCMGLTTEYRCNRSYNRGIAEIMFRSSLQQ